MAAKPASTQKIERQPPRVTISPPRMGARIGPRPRTSSTMDSTLADSRWSNRSRTMALEITTAALAPIACRKRRAIINGID